MINEVTIRTLGDLMPLLTEQEYRPEMDRNRSTYLYRGMPDSGYKMTTSLSRNCKHLQKTLPISLPTASWSSAPAAICFPPILPIRTRPIRRICFI